MKFLNDFAIALVHPSRYGELVKNTAGRVAVFAAVIVLLSSVTLVTGAVTAYNILGRYFEENVPEFEFKNQTLTSDDTFDLDFAGVKIVLDTTRQVSGDELEDASQGALFDGDSMIVKTGGRVVEARYTELAAPETQFTKASLYAYSGMVKVGIALSVVLSIILSAGGLLLGALIIAWLSSLLTFRLPRKNAGLTFGQVYKLAVYSRGLPLILSIVTSMIIGKIPFIISAVISIMILNTALFKISMNGRQDGGV